jgi:hypothetical protein
VDQTTLASYLESISLEEVMDGKHTHFDMRRSNQDDECSLESSLHTAGEPPVYSTETGTNEDTVLDRYDQSFMAERGLLCSPHLN